VPEVPPLKKAEQIDIPFQSAQAHVLIGQPGHKRSDPDYFALLVGNHVLGGNGFSSLLMNEVREKRGLSYGAYSHFQPALHAGAFSIGLQTRPDQAAQAVQVARQVLQAFVRQGPTEAQLPPEHLYSRTLLSRVSSQYDTSSPTLYGKIQCALDYISGMTDIYALDLYRTITGMNLPAV